ncbi:hypothetical protein POM88_039245 [Heracleum sosnowskyi]|uniref:RRM domain-containing protein n=1 Tax=Heracleum sosnowskyi TaxID=360622 RepID=A0AAD8HAV4_9APIA|nr:hypothetical protein POM88_039245 [Heracleum sosnowskyi]
MSIVPLGDSGEFLNSSLNLNQVKPYWIEKRSVKEDILEISKDNVKKIKEKVLKYGKLIEKDMVKALERGNEGIIRYAYNKLRRLEKLIDKELLEKLIDKELLEKALGGDEAVIEKARWTLLMSNWKRPTVKWQEENLQEEVLRMDNLLQDLLKSQYHWIDLNTKKSPVNHEVDVVEMALNQIHFNSLGKGREKVRDKNNQLSYAEIVLKGKGENDGWRKVTYKKKHPAKSRATVFISKIPIKAKAKDVWNFFTGNGKVIDIVLPKKKDKFKNIIEFVKTSSWQEAKELVEKSRDELFLGERMSISLTKSTDDTSKVKPRSVIGVDLKKDPVLKNGKVFHSQSIGSNENQFKCKVKTNNPSHEMLKMEINAGLQDILHRSKIGLTYFKMNEVTFSDVMKEMGFHKQISITELSSWKFLVSFSSQRDMNSFDFELLSSWFIKWEGVEANNFLVQGKAYMECRGLIFVAWNESNLKSISKDTGLWEDWVNENSLLARLENPIISLYIDRLDRIEEDTQVTVNGKTCRVILSELPFFSHGTEVRSEVTLENSLVNKEEGFSLISKVSNSFQKEEALLGSKSFTGNLHNVEEKESIDQSNLRLSKENQYIQIQI